MKEFNELPAIMTLNCIIDSNRYFWNSRGIPWNAANIGEIGRDLEIRVKYLEDIKKLFPYFPLTVDQRIQLAEYIDAVEKIPKSYLDRIENYKKEAIPVKPIHEREEIFVKYKPNENEHNADKALTLIGTNDICQSLKKSKQIELGLKTSEQLRKEAEDKVKSWVYNLHEGKRIPDKSPEEVSDGTWSILEITQTLFEDEEYDLRHRICIGVPIGHYKMWQKVKERRKWIVQYSTNIFNTYGGYGKLCYPELSLLVLEKEIEEALKELEIKYPRLGIV
jgi:hypothetical protein